MIRKLKSGTYRLYSRKLDPRTGKRRNLGTFATRAKAEQHERAIPILQAPLTSGRQTAAHTRERRSRPRSPEDSATSAFGAPPQRAGGVCG